MIPRVGGFEICPVRELRGRGRILAAFQESPSGCRQIVASLEQLPRDVARIALMMFNDVILRCGFERGLSIIDLRLIF